MRHYKFTRCSKRCSTNSAAALGSHLIHVVRWRIIGSWLNTQASSQAWGNRNSLKTLIDQLAVITMGCTRSPFSGGLRCCAFCTGPVNPDVMRLALMTRLNAKFSIRTMLGIIAVCCLIFAAFMTPTTYEIRHDTTGWHTRIVTAVGNPISIWAVDNSGGRNVCVLKDAVVTDIRLDPDRIDSIVVRVKLYQKLRLSLAQNMCWVDTLWICGNKIWTPETL